MIETGQEVALKIAEAVKLRKSIRGFKPDPVPRQVLQEILEIASRAPSAVNTQPWEFTIVAGEILDRIRQANVERLEAGVSPAPEVVVTGPFSGIYRQRQVNLGVQLYGLMGITREDKAGRAEWWQKGFRFFDAPAAIIISTDRSLAEVQPLLDIGGVAQTIALLALDHGLGTCIHDQGVMFPDVIRKYTGIPESKRIVICICIGYPDREFPANRIQSQREPIANITTWLGI